MNPTDGVIVVDKPQGWTSHDVVARMRGIAGTRRVGHLGTLDPIATGVLPLMIGQATRLARFWEGAEKCYEARVRFGFATSTYDREGEPCGVDTAPHMQAQQIEACLVSMRGEMEQMPPPFSAKKINGVPAYKLARKNIAVDLKPATVTVYELTLLEVNGPSARLRVRCSPGTYIRSIAHQLGISLGCGAHIDELARTRSGVFSIEKSRTLDELQSLKDEGRLWEALLPMSDLLPEFPSVTVDDSGASQIRQGRNFNVSPFRVNAGSPHVKAIAPDGSLVAIGTAVLPHVYHPVVVLPASPD
ncbi:MAG: tRNA pseudouridine(55) synthase TruB [Acidobacteriota bacterium]|nr:tRNA pseudouridine(55) synthase TruB [Acidobacteriota bacterium]